MFTGITSTFLGFRTSRGKTQSLTHLSVRLSHLNFSGKDKAIKLKGIVLKLAILHMFKQSVLTHIFLSNKNLLFKKNWVL